MFVFRNTFIDSNERVFSVNCQYAKCQTSMLCTNKGQKKVMFSRRFRRMFSLIFDSKVRHVGRSDKEHYESKQKCKNFGHEMC